MLSIAEEDLQGFMEVIQGITSEELDLILHLPGGSAEATESVVSFLRSKFKSIRVIVPHAAMSAATMLACSANTIVMGAQSSLGPIDPQIILNTPLGAGSIPAQAILDQFALAKRECQDPKLLAAWLPMLSQYGPALLVQCSEALNLSKELVTNWLTRYMFGGKKTAKRTATKIAKQLSNHKLYKTHARHINRDQARSFGLIVDDLEENKRFEELVMSVFHAITHTFTGTGATKIIESHNGRAFVKSLQIVVAAPQPPSTAQPPASLPHP